MGVCINTYAHGANSGNSLPACDFRLNVPWDAPVGFIKMKSVVYPLPETTWGKTNSSVLGGALSAIAGVVEIRKSPRSL